MISASAAPGEVIDVIFLAFTADHGGLDRSITHLAAILEAIQKKKCRLWILVRGIESAASDAVDPMAEAIWCFARVGMNEYPAVDLKLVDVALDLDALGRSAAGLHVGDGEAHVFEAQGAQRIARAKRPRRAAGARPRIRDDPEALLTVAAHHDVGLLIDRLVGEPADRQRLKVGLGGRSHELPVSRVKGREQYSR